MHRNVAPPLSKDMREISRVLASINDADTMKTFMEELLTPAEHSTLALRWKLLTLLHHRVPQRKIAGDLRISLCKITRGSKILKKNGSLTRHLLNEHYGPAFST